MTFGPPESPSGRGLRLIDLGRVSGSGDLQMTAVTASCLSHQNTCNVNHIGGPQIPCAEIHSGSACVDGPHEIGHPDGGHSGAIAVVPLLATGAVYCLLDRVRCQYAEYDRYTRGD